MSVVRVCALESLRDALIAAIPSLEDHVCIGQPTSNHNVTWPNVTLIATKWAYIPFQESYVDSSQITPTTSVYSVGEHEAPCQIRVEAATPKERDEIAGAIVDVFLAAQDENGFARPGILMTDVTDCGAIPWRAAWELEDDELVYLPILDRHYEAVIQLTGIIPALVTRLGEWTIDVLQLGIANLTVSVDADTFQPPHVEVVSIAEDGTISPVTP